MHRWSSDRSAAKPSLKSYTSEARAEMERISLGRCPGLHPPESAQPVALAFFQSLKLILKYFYKNICCKYIRPGLFYLYTPVGSEAQQTGQFRNTDFTLFQVRVLEGRSLVLFQAITPSIVLKHSWV
jgi:hypothetical protein